MNQVLNIVSDSLVNTKIGGPNKVVLNTIKGLEAMGLPFVINKSVYEYQFNWIHDSIKGFIEVSICKIPAVVGPNLVVLPKDLPPVLDDIHHLVYLHPSQWCVEVWRELGFEKCSLHSWPVGIDINEFKHYKRSETNQNVMIYYKRRDPVLLKKVISLVEKFGHTFTLVEYGTYSENYYKRALMESQFGIWLGVSESQGIALQEALATGLPLIVCNVMSLFESNDNNDYAFPEKLRRFKATSAPYFDERCGIIVEDFSKLEKSFIELKMNISTYNPRDFITENLSLTGQAKMLLSFFNFQERKILENTGRKFKLSYRGRLIYSIFILKRKTLTAIRLIRNYLYK